MEEQIKEDTQGQAKVEQRRILYPWLLLFLVMLTLGGYFYFHNQLLGNKPPGEKIAVVDVEALLAKHRDHGQRENLMIEIKDLQKQMDGLQREIALVQPASLKQEIYQEHLQKEEGLVDFQKENQIATEAIAQRKIIEEQLAAAKAGELGEINRIYGSQILSIQLKLENLDKMNLTKEEIDNLKVNLQELNIHRQKAVAEIESKYASKVDEDLKAWKEQRSAELGIKASKTKGTMVQLVAQREEQSKGQEQSILDDLQKVMELKSKLLLLQSQLGMKQSEEEMLRESMLADIESFAAKVAIEEDYDVVIRKDAGQGKYPLDGKKIVGTDITTKVEKALQGAGIIK